MMGTRQGIACNNDGQSGEIVTLKYAKTKKAMRKLKKQEQRIQKKRQLPLPKCIHYVTDVAEETVFVTGEIDRALLLSGEATYFIRFKLSGQLAFSRFGYQTEIPITGKHQFQFEIVQAALLDNDCIEIQLCNTKEQYSEVFVCPYVKNSVEKLKAEKSV